MQVKHAMGTLGLAAAMTLGLSLPASAAPALDTYGLIAGGDFTGNSNYGFNDGTRSLIYGNLSGSNMVFKGDLLVGGNIDAGAQTQSAGPTLTGKLDVAGNVNANVNVAGDMRVGGNVAGGLHLNGQSGRSFTRAGTVGGGTHINNFSTTTHDPGLTLSLPTVFPGLNSLSHNINTFVSSNAATRTAGPASQNLTFDAALADAVQIGGQDVVMFTVDVADFDFQNGNFDVSIESDVEAVLINVTGATGGEHKVGLNYNADAAIASKLVFNFNPADFNGANSLKFERQFFGTVLAPGMDLVIAGGNGVTGSVVGRNITATAQIHPAAPTVPVRTVIQTIPEPTTLALLGIGMIVMHGGVRRRAR